MNGGSLLFMCANFPVFVWDLVKVQVSHHTLNADGGHGKRSARSRRLIYSANGPSVY